MKSLFKSVVSRARRAQENVKNMVLAGFSLAPVAYFATPGLALAKKVNDNTGMLDNILGLIQGVVALYGAGLVVWGGFKFGMAVREQQGGAAFAEAIGTIGGGVIIGAAAVYFAMINN